MAKSWQRGPTLYVSASGNSKIGRAAERDARIDTTYAPIVASCPSSCAMRPGTGDGTCYASLGRVAGVVRRLEAHDAGRYDSATVARAEARAIRASYGGGPVPAGRPLRIHSSGDARTPYAARTIGAAATDRARRGGGQAWTYTHAWRDVPRSAWGPDVSVLASIDSPDDVGAVRAQGYAPARVVARHASARAWVADGVRWIPCPAQTREGTTCADCRLCWRADALAARGAGIACAAHSQRSRVLSDRLDREEVARAASRPAGRRALPLVA
jgi:hypothetical protein